MTTEFDKRADPATGPNGRRSAGPAMDVDIFNDSTLRDIYPVWSKIRDAGSVVYLPAVDAWIVTAHDEARAVLADWETYTSAGELVYGEEMAAALGHTPLTTDPPLHDKIRAVVSGKTAPKALRNLRESVMSYADALVAGAVEAGTVEAMETLCRPMSVDTVADLIGLPQEGRDILIPAGERMAMSFAPYDEAIAAQLPQPQEFLAYLLSVTTRDVLKPDSWGTSVLDAVDSGVIGPEDVVPIMAGYLIAGLGTTAHTIGFYLNNLARNPEAWAALKENPALIASGIEETLRLDGPAQLLYRATTRQVTLGDHQIPAGKRIIVSIGAANRDPEKYPDPDTFNIHRNPVDHLGLGYSTHACAGQGLARLEIQGVILSLLRRASSFELNGPVERAHHVPGLPGIKTLPIKLAAAQETL